MLCYKVYSFSREGGCKGSQSGDRRGGAGGLRYATAEEFIVADYIKPAVLKVIDSNQYGVIP